MGRLFRRARRRFLQSAGRLAGPVVRPQSVAPVAGAAVASHLVDALVLAVAVAARALVYVCDEK